MCVVLHKKKRKRYIRDPELWLNNFRARLGKGAILKIGSDYGATIKNPTYTDRIREVEKV